MIETLRNCVFCLKGCGQERTPDFGRIFISLFLQQEERRHNATIIYIATGKYICSFPVQFRLIVSAAVIPRSAPVAVHLQGNVGRC